MNILAHLHLSGEEPDILVGNLMGDFVKGRLAEGRYPPRITWGLELHRRIDSFAGGHGAFLASKRRLDPSVGLYRGVLVDLFYDHFLAAGWDSHAVEPLHRFIERSQSVALSHVALFPERLARLLPAIFGEWLPSYGSPEGIGRVLGRMAVRVGRPNPLAGGAGELIRCYEELLEDFRSFYPELVAFATEFRERKV
ncbi:MAG: DUF479 domain-containing protein [Desulfuromonadales bacterium]|nr:MAG: DUF479 domain-containing protein [Desulfuromonadales bacterium]